MSGWPKIICDPIHRIIAFEDKPWDRLLLRLIDTPEFQRLRRIKQLGMADQVFPGATHTRFAHSLGVMHTSRRLLNRLEEVTGERLEEYDRTIVLCSALLHDIGHGPFSHAFEKVTGENHERRTREVVLSESTEVGRVLAEHDSRLPHGVAAFFGDEGAAPGEVGSARPLPGYLKDLVSSQLDADRFDYLLRDSWATGTELGRFDMEYLLANLRLDRERQRLHLSGKAQSAAESYVEARAHMYRAVYFHKTIRSAEVMLRLALTRYHELLEEAATEKNQRRIVPEARAAVRNAFRGAALSLAVYLELDDVTVTDFLKAAAGAEDLILSSLARGIIERRLWKAVDLTDASRHAIAGFYAAATDLCETEGREARFGIVADGPRDTPYKLYDPDAPEPAMQIYIGENATTAHELSRRSPHVRVLAERYELTRYHFPPELRASMHQLLRKQLS